MPGCTAARSGRRVFSAVSAVCTACLVLAAAGCGQASPPAAQVRVVGGTATVALQPGDQFTWILRAPRGALSYRPRSGCELEEVFVGLMAYLDP
jgi:hypothetical protein